MAHTLPAPAHRKPPKNFRTGLDGVRATKSNLRIDSDPDLIDSDTIRNAQMDTLKAEILGLIDETRSSVQLSRETMAREAGCPASALSEALNGHRGNFAVQWLWAQDDAFLNEWIEKMQAKRGLTPESKLATKAARIGELVRLLVEVA